VVGIAGSGKVNPRLAHLRGKRSCLGTVSGHVFATFRVVEAECQFGAVKSARPDIQYWGFGI